MIAKNFSDPQSLVVYFYAAAFGYERLELDASETVYEVVAEEVCADYAAALQAVEIENERAKPSSLQVELLKEVTAMANLTRIPGIGKNMAQYLTRAGYPNIESLKGQDPDEVR